LVPLVAQIGSLGASSGSRLLTRFPNRAAEAAVYRFGHIVDQVGGLWTPQTTIPVPIPRKPDEAYYRRFARDFTRSYFYKNLLKCLLAAEVLQYHLTRVQEFHDLGAGSGAFTVALLDSRCGSKAELVDYSPIQLNLAKSVLKCLGYIPLASFLELDIAKFSSDGKDCVSSYALGESIQHGVNVLTLIEKASSFVLLDTPLFVKGVETHLKSRGHHVFTRYVEFEVSSYLGDQIEGKGGRFAMLFKSAAGRYEGPSWA
jgi:hypothetical protein